MIMLGLHFDEDPLMPEARAILADPQKLTENARMDRLFNAAKPSRDAARGPDGSHLFNAASRMRAWLSDPDRDFVLDGRPGATLLERLFPERWDMTELTNVQPFFEVMKEKSRTAGFIDPGASGIATGMAFLCGVGVLEDPSFTGGGKFLADPGLSPNDNRERLRATAYGRLELMMQIVRREGRPGDV